MSLALCLLNWNLTGPRVFWKYVLETLCEECGLRVARVTITRTVGTQKIKTQLCATCARAQGGWLFSMMIGDSLVTGFPTEEDESLGDESHDTAESGDEKEFQSDAGNEELDDHIAGAPLDALMDACFARDEEAEWDEDPFDDDDEGDFLAPLIEDGAPDSAPKANLFQVLQAVGGEADAVCPGCGASWKRIGLDERAGCSRCYATFPASLALLLEYVQRAPHHQGKSPRAAQKRVLRLEHLRQRRDHQLQLLQNRLAEAVRTERYEEAASLRDKIKLVSSSLF